MLALYIIGSILAYALMAGISGGKHHAISTAKRGHDPTFCFDGSWCEHACASVWLFGVFWPVALPVTAGIIAGRLSDKTGRQQAKHKRELAQAKHEAQLAEYKAREHAALERELALTRKK